MTSTWLDLVIWDWEGRKRWKGPKEIFHRGRHWSLTPCGACGLLTGLCKTILVNKEPFSIRAGSQEQKSFGVSWFFRGGNTLRDYPAGWENWHWLLLPPFHTVAQEVFSLPFAFSLGLFLLLHSASFFTRPFCFFTRPFLLFYSALLLFHSAFPIKLKAPEHNSCNYCHMMDCTHVQFAPLLLLETMILLRNNIWDWCQGRGVRLCLPSQEAVTAIFPFAAHPNPAWSRFVAAAQYSRPE